MEINKKPWPILSVCGFRNRIDTNPDFQRPPVWSLGQKQLLIDTILRGYDIPKLYWRKISKSPEKYEVVDGQQPVSPRSVSARTLHAASRCCGLERRDAFRHSNPHLAVFVEGGGIPAPVVELRRARVRVIRHLAGFGQRAVTFQVIGDAGGAHRMIADAGFDARVLRVALYEPVGVLLRHPVRRARRAPRGAK